MTVEPSYRDVAIKWKSGSHEAWFTLALDQYPEPEVVEVTHKIVDGETVVFITRGGGIYIVDGSDVSSMRISEPRIHPDDRVPA